MAVCVFFGHRDCAELDQDRLLQEIEKLIAQGVDTFYVGNQGQFDAYVRSILRRLQNAYPHIRYAVVLARLPVQEQRGADFSDTIFPEGLENTPPRFAIDRRNNWLVEHADYVICYVRHTWGGAYKFSRLAKAGGKKVINLCASSIKM